MKQSAVSRTPAEGKVFLEPTELDGYLGIALKIDRILYSEKTDYQDVAMVECGPLGRVLLLNGSIQLTEMDEPAYHEMLSHVPMLCHPGPKRALIIGGGDGGTLREVLKHDCVERVDLCEIDGRVIEACRRFMPQTAAAFDDPRANVIVADGLEFIKRADEPYDVIFVDSSDPEDAGPALELFGRTFHMGLKKLLSPGGIVVSQAESFNFYAPLLRKMFDFMTELYRNVYYYHAQVPTYLGGGIGFCYASDGPAPDQGPDLERLAKLGGLSYYTPNIHSGAFALPAHCLKQMPGAMARAQENLFRND